MRCGRNTSPCEVLAGRHAVSVIQVCTTDCRSEPRPSAEPGNPVAACRGLLNPNCSLAVAEEHLYERPKVR